jgi:hypothetical protein
MNLPSFLRHGREMSLLVVLFLASAPGRAQDEPKEQPKSDSQTAYVPAIGMEGFRYILQRRGLEPVQSIADVNEPSQTVIVLLGPASITSNDDLARIFELLKRGASLLVATDGATDSRLFELGVTITGARVYNEQKCYLHRPDFPFVEPIRSRIPDPDTPEKVFEGFTPDVAPDGSNAIATNETSILNLVPPTGANLRSGVRLTPHALARYPSQSFKESASSWKGNIIRKALVALVRDDLFAAGGKLGNGRFLVLADHSVFINWMILKNDNANREFIHSSMDWLQGPVDSANKKTKCLFIEDGEIKTDFDLPVRETEISTLDLMAKAMTLFESHGDRIVAELEERDFFNRTLLASVDGRDIRRGALIALTLCLLAVGLARLLRGRVAADPARTLVTPELAAIIPRGPLLKQRFEGQLDADNLYEAARNMARDFFGGMSVEPDSVGPPALFVTDQHPNAPELRSKIERLWQLGFGTQSRRISARDWRGLCDDLKKILEEFDRGWWKFVAPNKA